ncbi:MAG TPA: Hpt domain-containing protein [Actinotalea sp.]
MSAATPPPAAADAVVRAQALVARLWERFRPLAESRVETIEQYLQPEAGPSRERNRADRAALTRAQEAAHNLAGALGTYGRPEGSALALRIEHLLTDPTAEAGDPAHAALLVDLAQRLRTEVTR